MVLSCPPAPTERINDEIPGLGTEPWGFSPTLAPKANGRNTAARSAVAATAAKTAKAAGGSLRNAGQEALESLLGPAVRNSLYRVRNALTEGRRSLLQPSVLPSKNA